jgi:uncharacterized phage protein (TIGR01671 family)
MQTRIKIRGWNSTEKIMVENWLVIEKHPSAKHFSCSNRTIAVDVVMLSTGLFDKNKKEISVGDLLLFEQKNERIKIIYEVILSEGGYYAKFVSSKNDDSVLKYNSLFADRYSLLDFPFYLEQTIEIIGDIYRNPELLEDNAK